MRINFIVYLFDISLLLFLLSTFILIQRLIGPCIRKSTVAVSINHGTRSAKTAGAVLTNQAPTAPPIRQGMSTFRVKCRHSQSSRRYPTAPANEPGSNATVLVAFACAGSRIATKGGNVKRVPPPAIELSAPARSADTPRIRYISICPIEMSISEALESDQYIFVTSDALSYLNRVSRFPCSGAILARGGWR